MTPDTGFPVWHQNRMVISNKLPQASPGSRLRLPLSHPLWLARSFLPEWAQIKEIASGCFSRSKRGSSKSASCSFLLCFISFPLSHYSHFSSLSHLDQCPLCHQETCKPRLSTPLRCVLPGVPRALSLSMESTRDIRWAAPLCQLVHSSGQS